MSLHRRMSSLLVCNVITGWLWASVNKTNAQSPLEKDRKKSHYCLRLTADCQVCSWIHYSDSFRLSRIDSYLFLKHFSPSPATNFDRRLISISLLQCISFHQLRQAHPCDARRCHHYTLHDNTQAPGRRLSIKIQSGAWRGERRLWHFLINSRA